LTSQSGGPAERHLVRRRCRLCRRRPPRLSAVCFRPRLPDVSL